MRNRFVLGAIAGLCALHAGLAQAEGRLILKGGLALFTSELGNVTSAGLDFGVIIIRYMPHEHCLELKSLKEYLQSYRNLGIFQENIVNRVLEDVVRWADPVWAEVRGEFHARGGIRTTIVARWPRPK